MKSTGMISQVVKLVNERIKNQAACGGSQLAETDLCHRGRDFPASIKLRPKPRQREAKSGGFLHAVYQQTCTWTEEEGFFSNICPQHYVPLSLSGIRSSLSLMLYALIHTKDRDSQTNSQVSGGAGAAHPVPGCWSLQGWWQSPARVWRGAMKGLHSWGSSSHSGDERGSLQPGASLEALEMSNGYWCYWAMKPTSQ